MNNEIRSNLNKIVNQYGHYIYNEPNRCESLIRDYCNDDKKARNLLITALKECTALWDYVSGRTMSP